MCYPMRMKNTARAAIILTSATFLMALAACNMQPAQAPAAAPAAAPPAAPAEPAYIPGLGEIMTLNQMRHTKLWFAGQAGNWGLAAYGSKSCTRLDDAATFHPTHGTSRSRFRS